MRNVYIIAYDVVVDKRRTKVHKLLKGRGDALQYSLFHCALSPTELVDLKTAMWDALNLKDDRLVILDLGPQTGRATIAIDSWGKPLEEPPEPGEPMIV
jgi:CRISPR-associated protein Cas2